MEVEGANRVRLNLEVSPNPLDSRIMTHTDIWVNIFDISFFGKIPGPLEPLLIAIPFLSLSQWGSTVLCPITILLGIRDGLFIRTLHSFNECAGEDPSDRRMSPGVLKIDTALEMRSSCRWSYFFAVAPIGGGERVDVDNVFVRVVVQSKDPLAGPSSSVSLI